MFTGLLYKFKAIFIICVILHSYVDSNPVMANTVNDSLKSVIKTSDGKTKVDALNQLAYRLTRDQKEFHYYANRAIKLAKKLKYPKGISEAYRNYQWFYQYPGTYKLDSSLYYSTLEINYLESTPRIEMLGDAYIFRGRTFMIKRENDSAMNYYREALKLFSAFDNQEKIAQVYDMMGLMYYLKNNYHAAVNCFDSAQKYVKHTDSEERKANISYHMGLTKFHLAQHKAALNHIYEALAYYEKARSTANTWNSYELLGNIYLTLENHEAALRMH
ncbi:MAG: tetratricopeptide repeat protein, partial [Bacteroidales bacterium]|nr:tetratricopeptide repeat protein [Bacteroidales bacterium]